MVDDVQSQQRDCNATSAIDGEIKQEVNDEDDRYTPSSMGSHSSSNASKKNQPNVNYNKSSSTIHNDAISYRDQQQQRHNLLSASILLSRSHRHASATELNEMLQSSVPSGYLLPCPLCEAPLEPRLFRQHLDRHYPRDSPVCPVLQCGRRFAHPNSVRNHMRIKHTMQWAKMKAMRSSGGPFSGVADFKWSTSNWKCICFYCFCTQPAYGKQIYLYIYFFCSVILNELYSLTLLFRFSKFKIQLKTNFITFMFDIIM